MGATTSQRSADTPLPTESRPHRGRLLNGRIFQKSPGSCPSGIGPVPFVRRQVKFGGQTSLTRSWTGDGQKWTGNCPGRRERAATPSIDLSIGLPMGGSEWAFSAPTQRSAFNTPYLPRYLEKYRRFSTSRLLLQSIAQHRFFHFSKMPPALSSMVGQTFQRPPF
jgi:hypothetical protein